LVDLSLKLEVDPVTAEAFLSGDRSLLVRAGEVCRLWHDAKRQNAESAVVYNHLYELFGGSADMISTIDEVHAAWTGMNQRVQKLTKRHRQLKTAYSELHSAHQRSEAESSERIAALGQKITDLQSENSELAAANAKQKERQRALRSALRELEGQKDAIESELQAELNAVTAQFAHEKEALTTQFTDQIDRLNDEISNHNLELSDQARLISALKHTIQAQRDEIAEQAAAAERLVQTHKSELDKLHSHCDAEKQLLIESHNKSVSELTAQCQAHRTDLQELSAKLTSESERHKSSQRELFDSKLALGKLQKELAAFAERVDRDSRLHEAALTAATLKLETGAEQRISELKARHESEKRKLFAFVADQFRQFCDISQNISERSFREILLRVRSTLSGLSEMESALRRLTGAPQSQSVQEAVEQLVLRQA
jgi:chromosome segregation ATPase